VTAAGRAFRDRTYRENPDFFGTAASSLARSSLGLLLRDAAGGSIYELGTGTGRDLTYFAQHGFNVAGSDAAPVAARESNLRVSPLRDEVPPRSRVTPEDALTG
jgi:SAM-dependent methyltransferase